MISKLTKTPVTIALAVVMALAFLAIGPQLSDAHPRASRLVGVWRMTSLELVSDGRLRPVPYSGQIIFSRSGTVAVQAANPDATAPDGPYTLNGYEAYYGTSRVARSGRSLTMNVESALVRDLVGQGLNRNIQVSRDRLVLTPSDPAEGFRVTYERI